MRPCAVLAGPVERDTEVGVLLQQPGEVVVVADADLAAAGVDGLEQLHVVGHDLHVVGDPALDDLLGPVAAVQVDEAGHQALGVGRGLVAHADAALPLRVAERGVGVLGVQLGGVDLLGVVDDGARTHGQAVPAGVAVAQVLGHRCVEHRGVDGLQHALLAGVPEHAGVDGHEHVGGGVGALGLEPLEQLGVVAVEELHGQPGLVGELRERLLQGVVPRGVHLQVGLLAAEQAAAGQREGSEQRRGQRGQGAGEGTAHRVTPGLGGGWSCPLGRERRAERKVSQPFATHEVVTSAQTGPGNDRSPWRRTPRGGVAPGALAVGSSRPMPVRPGGRRVRRVRPPRARRRAAGRWPCPRRRPGCAAPRRSCGRPDGCRS